MQSGRQTYVVRPRPRATGPRRRVIDERDPGGGGAHVWAGPPEARALRARARTLPWWRLLRRWSLLRTAGRITTCYHRALTYHRAWSRG